jgi:RimJ/RimL family protein N-acetyltransferase
MAPRAAPDKEGAMDDAQQLGRPVPGWVPPPRPRRVTLEGRHVTVEPLVPERHGAALFAANGDHVRLWDYLPYGPFADLAAYRRWLDGAAASTDPMFMALCDRVTGAAGGVASYLRIAPEAGSVEVGHICLSPAMQGSRAATEAMTLMMAEAFALGYRRYEWKCNVLNRPSLRAALRLGFSFEGVFRQAAVVKGRNRDTAWFSVTDGEWPWIRDAHDRWLDPANFDAEGRQRTSLSALVAAALPDRARPPGL